MKVVEIETPWSRKQRQRLSTRFLKGPISLPLLQEVAQLPGKALALYLAIRHRADLCGSPEVTLPTNYLADWGIDKYSKHRALTALERVGLVRTERCPGHTTRVTLNDPRSALSGLKVWPQVDREG